MKPIELHLTRWNRASSPDDGVLRHALRAENLSVLEWSDAPSTIYPVHTHPFAQVRLVLSGRLRIGLPETGEEIALGPGDRLDLPPEVPHWEEVDGPQAALYLAASREKENQADANYASAKL